MVKLLTSNKNYFKIRIGNIKYAELSIKATDTTTITDFEIVALNMDNDATVS